MNHVTLSLVTSSFYNLIILLEHLSSPPVLSGVLVNRSLVLCVMFCRSLFVLFLLASFELSVLRFMDSDYLFDIFQLLELYL